VAQGWRAPDRRWAIASGIVDPPVRLVEIACGITRLSDKFL
jgi:hypothetical protein